MTKKDYELIAGAIKRAMGEHDEEKPRVKEERTIATIIVASRLADSLWLENKRFDRARFVAACGFPVGGPWLSTNSPVGADRPIK